MSISTTIFSKSSLKLIIGNGFLNTGAWNRQFKDDFKKSSLKGKCFFFFFFLKRGCNLSFYVTRTLASLHPLSLRLSHTLKSISVGVQHCGQSSCMSSSSLWDALALTVASLCLTICKVCVPYSFSLMIFLSLFAYNLC